MMNWEGGGGAVGFAVYSNYPNPYLKIIDTTKLFVADAILRKKNKK